MIDGMYNIEVDTLLGRRPGTVEMRTEGDTVFVDIDAPVIGEQHVEAKTEGDSFTAEGSFRVFLLGEITYTLHCEVKGDDLNIHIDSSKGVFELIGKRA